MSPRGLALVDDRADSVDARPFEPSPDLCGPADVAKVLRLSYSRVMTLQREGKLRQFEHSHPITNKRYSGRKLDAYRRDETAGRHYFGRRA